VPDLGAHIVQIDRRRHLWRDNLEEKRATI